MTNHRGLDVHLGPGQGTGKQSLKGDPDPTDTDRRYTALFPNNNALAVNLILILTTKYGTHTAEQCVMYNFQEGDPYLKCLEANLAGK